MREIIKSKAIIIPLFFAAFIYCTTFLCAATTLNVGSGQTYSTNGIDDQVSINNAILAANSGDIIYIHAGTYSISAPINVGKSNIIIKGDGPKSTVICAASYDDFFGTKHNDLTRSFIQLKAVDNVEIYGFTLKGTSPQIEPEYLSDNKDDSSENGMLLIDYVTNTKIHDIVFTLISGDGIYVCDSYNSNKNNGTVYNCVFDTDNHDCIEACCVRNWHIYNCKMNFTSNCGVRFVNCEDSEISNCTMYAPAGNHANGGIYFQDNNENITVNWNVFHDIQVVPGYGIYVTGEESGHITIHDNVFYNCRGGGIYTGNLVTTSYNNQYPSTAFNWTAAGYGYDAAKMGSTGTLAQTTNKIYISALHVGAPHQTPNQEYVKISNKGTTAVSLKGWKITDQYKKYTYYFPSSFVLKAKSTITLKSGKGANTASTLYWNNSFIWNNTEAKAYLYNAQGKLVSSRKG